MMKNRDDLIAALNQKKRFKYIYFWGEKDNGSSVVTKACFSQWYPAPFTVDGIKYPTTEHYMMAQKAKLFEDEEAYQKIVQSRHPGQAKQFGREVLGFDNKVWQENRFEIVIIGNVAKFSDNPGLGDFLKGTGARVLVEASPVDTIWGVGLSAQDPRIENPRLWKGENLLGFALMAVRERFDYS